MVKVRGEDGFSPILARRWSIHTPTAPTAFDCVKLIFVRDSSAILLSEFGEKRVTLGDKTAYRRLGASLGGRNNLYEGDKLSDVWALPVSSGGDGHEAQFPLALPGRCIAISIEVNDVVLDPFVGSGNTAVAALALGRRVIEVDFSRQYRDVAEARIRELEGRLPAETSVEPTGSDTAGSP